MITRNRRVRKILTIRQVKYTKLLFQLFLSHFNSHCTSSTKFCVSALPAKRVEQSHHWHCLKIIYVYIYNQATLFKSHKVLEFSANL